MTDATVQQMVKTAIQTQVITALTEGPKMIEDLVKAAFAQQVDPTTGRTDGYGSKISYLDWLVLDTIRSAARTAVTDAVTARIGDIRTMLAEKVTQATVDAAAAKLLGDFANQSWRLEIKFRGEDR